MEIFVPQIRTNMVATRNISLPRNILKCCCSGVRHTREAHSTHKTIQLDLLATFWGGEEGMIRRESKGQEKKRKAAEGEERGLALNEWVESAVLN